MWQQFFEQHSDKWQVLSVAVDLQGAEAAAEWPRRYGCQFTTVVDSDNLLSRTYGFKIVPNLFILDENGVIQGKWYAFWPSVKEEHMNALKELAAGNFEPFEKGNGMGPLSKEGAMHLPSPAEQELYETRVRLGQALVALGKKNEAVVEWKKALLSDPENFTLRKQIWAIVYPEKFGDTIDFDWQKERLRLDLEEEEAMRRGECGPEGCLVRS